MNPHSFQELIRAGSGLVISKVMMKVFGLEMAVFLADLADRDSYFRRSRNDYEDWFFSTKEYRAEDMGWSEKTLTRLMREAEQDRLVQTRMCGIPAKQWIRVNYLVIFDMISESLEKSSLPRTVEASLPRTVLAYINDTNITKEETPYNPPERKSRRTTMVSSPLRGSTPPPTPQCPADKIDPINFLHFFPPKYFRAEIFVSGWKDFVEHRKLLKKPLNLLSAKRCANKLMSLCNHDLDKAVAIIDRSIEKKWDTVYAFPEDFKKDGYLEGIMKRGEEPPKRGPRVGVDPHSYQSGFEEEQLDIPGMRR